MLTDAMNTRVASYILVGIIEGRLGQEDELACRACKGHQVLMASNTWTRRDNIYPASDLSTLCTITRIIAWSMNKT